MNDHPKAFPILFLHRDEDQRSERPDFKSVLPTLSNGLSTSLFQRWYGGRQRHSSEDELFSKTLCPSRIALRRCRPIYKEGRNRRTGILSLFIQRIERESSDRRDDPPKKAQGLPLFRRSPLFLLSSLPPFRRLTSLRPGGRSRRHRPLPRARRQRDHQEDLHP